MERLQLSYLRFRHKISPILFLISFVLDLYMLKQPDSKGTIIFISTHFVLTIILMLLTAYAANRDMDQSIAKKWSTSRKIFLEILLQFTFGALASALFVLYFKGSDLIASLPFLFLLAIFLFGNEFVHKHTSRLEVRFASTIFLGYSFLLYLVPLFRGELGNVSFIISTISAFLIAIAIFFLIRKVGPTLFLHSKKVLVISIISLFLGTPFLVYYDIFPPLPLILREGSVAHTVNKVHGVEYEVEVEAVPPYMRLGLPLLLPVYHVEDNSELAFFTAVYTPKSITAKIVHVWRLYEPDSRTYVERSKIPLTVTGGRESGFRTYSIISDPEAGLWSVSAELPNGQVLGQRKFIVREGKPLLVKDVK